ncbi:MAG: hypothetical protein R3Y47_04200 [Lachnospiraceae bacterium]
MKKLAILFLVMITMLCTIGCGADSSEDTALLDFQTQLQEICDNIEEIDAQMNALDPNIDNAEATMLSYLNALSAEFDALEAIEIPNDDYAYMTSLSQEACDYMDESIVLYFEILGQGTYTDESIALAYENYSRACKRVQVIVALLHGEVPEDATVTYE